MKKIWIYAALVGILLAGLLLSAFYAPVWYDDAGHFLVARSLAERGECCYPLSSEGGCESGSAFITMGPALTYPLAAWLSVFGATMTAARMLMVLLSLATALMLFLLAKRLTNTTKAAIAVFFIAFNIQFLTYGAEVLGEVPMMGLLLAGAMGLLAWRENGNIWGLAAGMTMWCLAVLVKEYALLPIGLSFLIWWLFDWWLKRKAGAEPMDQILSGKASPGADAHVQDGAGEKAEGQGGTNGSSWAMSRTPIIPGLLWLLAIVALLVAIHGGPTGYLSYLKARSSYDSEFLAMELGNSLKFLLLKPLYWLGTLALVVRLKVRQRPQEAFMLAVLAAWTIFFLLTAGYDRFGFLLLFIPAIYLAEFIPFLWKELGRIRHWIWLKRGFFLLICLAVFSQQTIPIIGKRLLAPEQINALETWAAKRIEQMKPACVMTAEQQLVLFLHKEQCWRLVTAVPSEGRKCQSPIPDFEPHQGDLFVAGPYALTEYQRCIPWDRFLLTDSLVLAGEKWALFLPKP